MFRYFRYDEKSSFMAVTDGKKMKKKIQASPSYGHGFGKSFENPVLNIAVDKRFLLLLHKSLRISSHS